MPLIFLTKGYATVVDTERYFELNQFKWYASGLEHRPARRLHETQKRLIYMYHQILGVMPWELGELVVDHIDRDPLNNTRENLRIVTKKENMQNSVTSIYKLGVSVDRTYNRYKAYIDRPNRKRINVGTYLTREAAEYALQEAKKLLGE